MLPLISKNLWNWVEENRDSFQPPVGNKVVWEDSQFTAMVIRGPNARRDFHIDPFDEIFYQVRGDIVVEYLNEQRNREEVVVAEGDLFLVPALVPHSPHRPAESWGLVVEIKRTPDQQESLLWLCDRCNAVVHEVTLYVADIEKQLKATIEAFDSTDSLRTCKACGYVQPSSVEPITVPKQRTVAD